MKQHPMTVLIISCSLGVGCLVSGCGQADNTNLTRESRLINYCNAKSGQFKSKIKAENWRLLTGGLWVNRNGDIGYKTEEATEICNTPWFITKLDEATELRQMIDTETIQHLGRAFYKDKKHIYFHRINSGGGYFQILNGADNATFTLMGNCYAKDKHYIYTENGEKILDIDRATFKTSKDTGCFAKDKNGYFFWGERKTLDRLDDHEKVLTDNLDKL